MAETVQFSVEDSLATVRLSRTHGNAINGELVDDLTAACQEADAREDVRGVLLCAAGKLFSPGLDLVELSELDRPQMERFMARFNACVLRLHALAKPVVAAVHGPAVAGGCVLALATDWRVLRRGALIGLNEVRVGVPLPFGVAMLLRDAVSPAWLTAIALDGRNFSDEDAVAAGLTHELHEAEGFEEHCRARLAALAAKDASAYAITKRYLRSAVHERIRAHDAPFLREWLDAWFSPPTRERVREIVAGLRERRP